MSLRSEPLTLKSNPCIAIIIPFRRQAEQDREGQLTSFLKHMAGFLRSAQFVIVVAEQSDDGRKFNRGQLLNIGFDEAQKHTAPTPLVSVIFHDVDLLPNDALLPYYVEAPTRGRPTHLAGPATWRKYAGMGAYEDVFFGGVTAFHPADFASCNGFPNTYWGWGLEDDQLRLRAEESGCLLHGVRRPGQSSGGSFVDLDQVQVLAVLQDPAKRVRDLHLWNDMFLGKKQGVLPLDDGWDDANGLAGLQHRVLNREASPLGSPWAREHAGPQARVVRVRVELGPVQAVAAEVESGGSSDTERRPTAETIRRRKSCSDSFHSRQPERTS